MSYAIEIENLTKFYGKTRGVERLSFSVEQGDFFGFIGPNGAGKSTTIRALLGLIRPDCGSARLLGAPSDVDRKALLGRIGYMPSEASFYNNMRVGELIAYSARLRGLDCSAVAGELCERLQLDVSRRSGQLSYGNRKKAAIVCCLQHNPELIILDEPTGGLDPLMQREFFEILRERQQAGATVFLSSHILSEVQQHCNNAAIIRGGSVVAAGGIEQLSSTGARRVRLVGVTEPPALPGLRDVERLQDTVSFLFDGDINLLIAAVTDMKIADMTVTEPTLEEVFMHYYEQEGE